ncbi:MAG: NADH:flavin oxidoreductase [bacterium]
MLFNPLRLRNLELENRFIHSATYESMATLDGEVTDALVERYRKLAQGKVGLLIPGYLFVHSYGRAALHQAGIHDDAMIPGLRRLTDAVHAEGGRVAFQLMHAGRQTKKKLSGQKPHGPSRQKRDELYLSKAKAMSEEQIQEAIEAFTQAAARAVEAGADVIQLHAAHGYLLNQFLSPFYNKRSDQWGGSDENRFRLLGQVLDATRKAIPDNTPILVKLNSDDYTPEPGVTPEHAVTYAKMLAEREIDLIEVSSGTLSWSFLAMSRGGVPVDDLARTAPWILRPIARRMMRKLEGKFTFETPYNLESAARIKEAVGEVMVSVVGGVRKLSEMKQIVSDGRVDCVSLSRPFIREPFLVTRFREGEATEAACISCNRCLAAVGLNLPLRCYVRGINVDQKNKKKA